MGPILAVSVSYRGVKLTAKGTAPGALEARTKKKPGQVQSDKPTEQAEERPREVGVRFQDTQNTVNQTIRHRARREIRKNHAATHFFRILPGRTFRL